jgi:non-ribosomal peptide synthetase component F
MTEHDRFRTARDLLLAHRTDLDAACAAFEWPALERFDWAVDWFDAIARDNDAPALHIVEETGTEAKLSYAELSRRSSQVANWLAGLGAKPGDRMLLMLGNEVPLWETMLAAIKLGIVVIPATLLLSGPDLADRIARGRVRWVLTNGSGWRASARCPAGRSTAWGWCWRARRAATRPEARRPAGSTTATRCTRPTRSRAASRCRSTRRCSSTSRRAPPRGPSSSATRARAIRSGTSARCTGSG